MATDCACVTLPAEGRTVTSLTAYLADNAYINVRDYGADATGATSARTAILAAFSQAGSTGAGLYFPRGTYLFDGANHVFTVPLAFETGAVLKVAAGTIVYLRPIRAGCTKVFDATRAGDSSKGTVYFNPAPSETFAEWWGAAADDATDNTDHLQAAIDSVAYFGPGGVIQLMVGTYRFTTLKWYGSLTGGGGTAVRMRGVGRQSTVLKTTVTDAPAIVVSDVDVPEHSNAGSSLSDVKLTTQGTPISGAELLRSTANNFFSLHRVDFENYYVGCRILGVAMYDCTFGFLVGGQSGGAAVYMPDAVGVYCERVIINTRNTNAVGFWIDAVTGTPDTLVFVDCAVNRPALPGQTTAATAFKVTRQPGAGYPRWLRLVGCLFECDENTSGIHCVDYQAGKDLQVVGGYILGGDRAFSMAGPTSNYAYGHYFSNCVIFGAMRQGVFHNPADTAYAAPLTLRDVEVCENSRQGAGLWPGVYLGSNSRGFTMSGGSSGVRGGESAGAPCNQSYGIEVDNAARNFLLDLNSIDLKGNATSPIACTPPTVASAATISPHTDTFFVSGVAAVTTISLPDRFRTLSVIPTGPFTWNATGNIAAAGVAVVGRLLTMRYNQSTLKWYPSYT